LKVKLLVSRCGTDFVQNAGEVVDIEDAEAKRVIDAGQGVAVEAETAVRKPVVKKATRKVKPKVAE
jgi:hypothetical protein